MPAAGVIARKVLLALALLGAGAAPAAGQEPRLVRLGTASLAGAYFPIGVALCRLVNEERRVHGIRCAADPSPGSVENIRALRAGEIDFAIVQSDVQEAAMAGTGPFAEAGPFPDLRAVMALHAEPLTVVARADAGIAGVNDLPGHQVAYGADGSGQRVVWDALAAAMGWNGTSFPEALALASTDQASALCAGQIDAFAIAIGHPAAIVREATSGCDVRLVPVTGPQIQALVAADPAYVEARIPGGLYPGNPGPVPTFGVGATLVTRADVPDDVVATLAGNALDKLDTLRTLDPALAGLDPAAMAAAGLSAPLHPAAERAFQEHGISR